MGQQNVLVAKKASVLGSIRKSIGSSLTETILSYYSDLIKATSGVLFPVLGSSV